MTFDSIPIREKVERDKYLRVEHLVKILTTKCLVCLEPIVWAGVNAAGKRLPFDTSTLLTNPQKVVISSDDQLDVWAMQPPPLKHICDPAKAQEEHERRCSLEVARLREQGHIFRSSRMGLDSETPLEFPPYGSSWGYRP